MHHQVLSISAHLHSDLIQALLYSPLVYYTNSSTGQPSFRFSALKSIPTTEPSKLDLRLTKKLYLSQWLCKFLHSLGSYFLFWLISGMCSLHYSSMTNHSPCSGPIHHSTPMVLEVWSQASVIKVSYKPLGFQSEQVNAVLAHIKIITKL